MTEPSNPYRAAGAYAGEAYVSRHADAQLLEEVQENRRIPYIVGPRQAGKTSLITHTRKNLPEREFTSVTVDFSLFGPNALSDYDTFLEQFLSVCASGLTSVWTWSARKTSVVNAFNKLLGMTKLRLVVFVDEVDVLLGTPFSNQFFSLIRSLHERRAQDGSAAFQRLQFVLTGTAREEELISDLWTSPFNIGARIDLDDLTQDQIREMSRLLPIRHDAERTAFAHEIHRWTGGTVFLTQYFCEELWSLIGNSEDSPKEAVDTVAKSLLSNAANMIHFVSIFRSVRRSAKACKALDHLERGEAPEPEGLRVLQSIGISSHSQPFKCRLYECVFGLQGPLSLVNSDTAINPNRGIILQYPGDLLLDRIKFLFDLMDPKHINLVAKDAQIGRTSLQRYLGGMSMMRLHNLGKLLTTVRRYFDEHPSLRSKIDYGLLDPTKIVEGLLRTEYEELGVSGPEELLDALMPGQMPRADFRPIAQEIIDKYEQSELFTKQLYIPLTAHTLDKKQLGIAHQALLELVASDVPVLFLLCDLGIGKTTTVKHLEYLIAKEFLKEPGSRRFPIYINLREFNKAISMDRYLLCHFSEMDAELSVDDIRKLVETGHLIFLFDGFDEMAERITTLECQRNLDQIALWSHTNGKLLLSSRTHFYKSDRDILDAYDKVWPAASSAQRSSPLILNRFTEADWMTYLNRVFGAQADEYKEKIKRLFSYDSLMTHPLLLAMTIEVLPTLVQQEEIRRIDVFEQYVMRWTKREEWRSSLTPDQRLRLAEELAWSLFIHNSPYISFQDLPHLAEEFFPDVIKGRDLDVLHNEIRTASFLTRTNDGNYSFISPVFVYYFQARAIQKRIERNDPANVGRERLHEEVLELLAEMRPDTNTLMGWSSRQTDRVLHVVGPYLQHNAQAILAKINPIKTELLGKLENVPRRNEFASDPLLAHIANTSLPRLKEPIRTIDIFSSYVDPWFAERAAELKGPESHVYFLIEEFAWVLNSHPRVTPEVFRLNLPDAEHPVPTGGKIRELFASCPFLQREGDTFSFQHEYLREYFLAKAIFYRIGIDHPVHAGHDLWSARVLELLAEMKPEPDNLVKWIQLTRKPAWNRQETGVYLASNAMSLLHLQKRSFAELALDDAKLPEVALPGVSLEGKSLVRVGFSKADLQGAILKEANLSGANLDGADLRGAVLTRANLTGADLSNANLEGAYLRHADLTDAYLDDANLERALTDSVIWGDARDAESLCREAVKAGDYAEGRRQLLRVVKRFPERSLIRREFGFVFDLDANLEDETAKWRKEGARIDYRRALWAVLSQANGFTVGEVLSDSPKDTSQKLVDEPVERDVIAIAETVPAESTPQTPEEKGEALEQAVLKLFRRLFVIGEADEQLMLKKLRQQKRGTQFGFDVGLTWSVRKHENVRCLVECKNLSRTVTLDDIAGKLASAKALVAQGSEDIDHWILISPRADVTAELNLLLERWDRVGEYPFKIHMWTPLLASRFFGLVPEVYDEFGFTPEPSQPHPHDWSDKRREDEVSYWLEQLRPPMRFPTGWAEYLRFQRGFELPDENPTKLSKLYQNHIPLRAADETGTLLRKSLETTVREWLEESSNEPPTLILLGEFGDGKSSFTYLLGRSLLEEFIENDFKGWIPVRFALREFAREGIKDGHDLLDRRLKDFEANIAGWNDIRRRFRVLVILDGFDEMSKRLDQEAVNANIRKLKDCCQEQFRDMKVLLTSRTHFLESRHNTDVLREELRSPKMLYLRRFEREQVLKKLDELVTTSAERERLHRFQQLHDPIGLATKPLFFDMIQSTFRTWTEDEIDEVVLYEQYASDCLRGKPGDKPKDLDRDGHEIGPDTLVANMLRILESLAMKLHASQDEFVLLKDLPTSEHNAYARLLWNSVERDELEESDATARVGVRSLLRRMETGNEGDQARWPVDFCHRSMKEYFVARAICRRLVEEVPDERLLSNVSLNGEIIHFASLIMAKGSPDEWKVWEERLRLLLSHTLVARTMPVDPERRAALARLGANAVGLLYRWKHELPGQYWDGYILDGADLAGADLAGKNFRGTSLRYANLENVNFEGADFTDADLTGVRLEETAPVLFLSAPLTRSSFYAGYKDGTVRQWQTAKTGAPQSRIVHVNESGPLNGLACFPGNNLCVFTEQGLTFLDAQADDRFGDAGGFDIDSSWETIRVRDDTVLIVQRGDNANRRAHIVDLTKSKVIRSMDVGNAILCHNLGTDGLIYQDDAMRLVLFEGSDSKPIEIALSAVEQPTCLAIFDETTSNAEIEYFVACGQRNGVVHVWRISRRPQWAALKLLDCRLHNGIVTSVAFIDGRHLLSGGNDRQIIRSTFDGTEQHPVERPSYALSIRCRGMTIDGVKSEKEHRLLKSLIAQMEV